MKGGSVGTTMSTPHFLPVSASVTTLLPGLSAVPLEKRLTLESSVVLSLPFQVFFLGLLGEEP